MPLRVKDAMITDIENTETKKLRVLRMTSKEEGIALSIELPEALCGPFHVKDMVSVIIDSEELTKGEGAKLYAEGTVFKIDDSSGLSVTITFGGLRLMLTLPSPKPSHRKIFDSKNIFLAIV